MEEILWNMRDLRSIDINLERELALERKMDLGEMPILTKIDPNLVLQSPVQGNPQRDLVFDDHPILQANMIEPVMQLKMESPEIDSVSEILRKSRSITQS